MEFDTWVPYVKKYVPRSIVACLLISSFALGVIFARDQALQAAFYLLVIIAINAVLWRMEQWTSTRDRAAIEARVPTRGWGVDPSRPLMDRFRIDAEVRQRKS